MGLQVFQKIVEIHEKIGHGFRLCESLAREVEPNGGRVAAGFHVEPDVLDRKRLGGEVGAVLVVFHKLAR